MIPRRVWFATLLAFICHGLFILTVRYRMSYDAYTHMLFANHYAENWFSLWEARWYTGFDIISYPPLTHQLIALFTFILGFEKAYALVLWLVTTLYPLGVYAFSRNFAGKTAASYAAIASAILLPIYVTAHIFGQLPFLTATLFALFGSAVLARFLREGGLHNFLLAVFITAATMAAHHATLLVQPFFILAIFVKQLNKDNWKTIIARLALFVVFAVPAGLGVIWPFWQWGAHQQMQTPIDHPSRHNLLTDLFAQTIFFWPFYLPLGAVIPFIFYKWNKTFFGLQFSFLVLFIIGLGGTTPLPALLFGKSWEWLTYDRFAFWASLTLLPFFGILFIRFRRRMKNRFTPKPIPASLRGTFISAVTFSVFFCSSIGSWFTPFLFPVQPARVDMQPIVDFLNEGDNSQWRYLTFGFGDQFAYLNLLTTATTIDGSYHTARTLPELRESGIGQVDTAFWTIKGIPAIAPILEKSGGHGVRWGFVDRAEYISQLRESGWVFVKTLENGIQVWENPNAILPEPTQPPPQNPFASFSWGILPMFSLVITLSLGALMVFPVSAEKIIRGAHALTVGLIPVSLCFWYYRVVGEFPHDKVYFTYDHALFFLSDGLALLAVVLWLSAKVTYPVEIFKNTFDKLFFALCCLITASIIWSADWRTSLYLSIHFWLLFGLIRSMRDWAESWNTAMLGFCAALSVQALTGISGFFAQSTAFLAPLQMNWPGLIDPLTRAASILKLPNGQFILRAYGTLPHPNILGGFLLLCFTGCIAIYMRKERPIALSLSLLALGACTLAMSFSRSAWLGAGAFLFVLLVKSKFFETKKILIAIAVLVIAFTATLIPLRSLFLSRTSTATPSESFAVVGRTWLIQKAFAYTRERPLTGVGIGSFIIQLAKRDGQRDFVEPVHNIPILGLSELGIFGLVLLILVAGNIGWRLYQTKNPNAILIGATLAGIGVIALFDHYFWTLAPGRVMLALALGLWEGQSSHDA